MVDHAVPAMWRSLAAASFRADCPLEGADHAGARPDLAQDALERVVGADAPPVLLREGIIAQCLLDRRFSKFGGLGEAVRRKPRSFSITRMLSRAATTSPLAWIALSMAAISRNETR